MTNGLDIFVEIQLVEAKDRGAGFPDSVTAAHGPKLGASTTGSACSYQNEIIRSSKELDKYCQSHPRKT
jgi:hypothetical protein